MIYGYARVSTQGLEVEGAQDIYEEKFTGDRSKRNELMAKLAAGNKLIVTKFNRLARNTKECIENIEQLFAGDVKVYVLNVGLLDNTLMGDSFYKRCLQ